jgi:hypothetical protein
MTKCDGSVDFTVRHTAERFPVGAVLWKGTRRPVRQHLSERAVREAPGYDGIVFAHHSRSGTGTLNPLSVVDTRQ